MPDNEKTGGISTLVGFTLGDWLQLLKDNRFSLSMTYRDRWFPIFFFSIRNSQLLSKENKRFGEKIDNAVIKPPIFIIGHWRSGTTLLHSLLTVDSRFAYPNLFQVTFPHSFLTLEEMLKEKMEEDDPEKRPMDNMEVSYDSPGEDEFALAVLSLRSPILGWMFPRREAYYDRYLTFKDVPQSEIEIWQSSFINFLKKLSFRYPNRLVLKSPQHTARVRLLLEMFPDAQFIYISRHPHQVFRSTQRLYRTAVARNHVQTAPDEDIDDGIIERYREMNQAYLDDRHLIPDGNLYELHFEDLEKDMLGQVRAIYQHLGLDDFQSVEPALTAYINSMSAYKKNNYAPLSDEMKDRLARAWQPMFDAFGYDPE